MSFTMALAASTGLLIGPFGAGEAIGRALFLSALSLSDLSLSALSLSAAAATGTTALGAMGTVPAVNSTPAVMTVAMARRVAAVVHQPGVDKTTAERNFVEKRTVTCVLYYMVARKLVTILTSFTIVTLAPPVKSSRLNRVELGVRSGGRVRRVYAWRVRGLIKRIDKGLP